MEFAGVVDKLGAEVRNWRLGDRVFGLLSAGGYAEQVLTWLALSGDDDEFSGKIKPGGGDVTCNVSTFVNRPVLG